MKNRIMYTYAGGGGRALPGKSDVTASLPAKYGTGSAGAFTMAEILLSLTIIGVVAAITLPSLTGNINERTWNTQRKALYARMSQAVSLMPALNGYGTQVEGDELTEAVDNVAETFVTAGLSKVLKINNICDSEHLHDCGLSSKITPFSGDLISSYPRTFLDLNPEFSYSTENKVNNYSFADSKAAAFETVNGESIAVYYNPKCVFKREYQGVWEYINIQPEICVNMVYDLNGAKGPNTVGKDIGTMTILYASDSAVVAPKLRITTKKGSEQGEKVCREEGENYRYIDADNAYSIWVNKKLWGVDSLTTSTKIIQNGVLKRKCVQPPGSVWAMSLDDIHPNGNPGATIYCVER